MNWFTRVLQGLELINQLLPIVMRAQLERRVQVKPIEVQVGSRYKLSGATDGSGDIVFSYE